MRKENEKRRLKNFIYYTANKLHLWRIFHTYQSPYILAHKTINIFLKNQSENLRSSDVKIWNIDSWNFTVILLFKKVSGCHKKKKETRCSPMTQEGEILFLKYQKVTQIGDDWFDFRCLIWKTIIWSE